MENIPALLRDVPLFSGLTDNDLEHLAEVVHKKGLAKGQQLFQQGDPGDEFLVIIEGSVKVELTNADGKELTLAILRSKQFLGELSLLDDFPRSASVVTLEDTKFLSIHKRDFHRLVDQYPRMALPMMRQLTRRVRILTDDIASMAFMDSFTRVARKLVGLAQDMGQQSPDGKITIPQPLTHQELANLVGTTRETVTKILNEMKEKNLIQIQRHRITIQNPKQFAERANLPSFSI